MISERIVLSRRYSVEKPVPLSCYGLPAFLEGRQSKCCVRVVVQRGEAVANLLLPGKTVRRNTRIFNPTLGQLLVLRANRCLNQLGRREFMRKPSEEKRAGNQFGEIDLDHPAKTFVAGEHINHLAGVQTGAPAIWQDDASTPLEQNHFETALGSC